MGYEEVLYEHKTIKTTNAYSIELSIEKKNSHKYELHIGCFDNKENLFEAVDNVIKKLGLKKKEEYIFENDKYYVEIGIDYLQKDEENAENELLKLFKNFGFNNE